MEIGNIGRYLKSMSMSIVMMLLLTYGMATKNPWINIWTILLIVLGTQFAYQIIQNARSRHLVEANLRDASRVNRQTILFNASERDVNKAKIKGGGERSIGSTMLLMVLAPLIIFITAGYLLRMFVPGIEQWQSYMIAFLLTLPVNTILTVKMGRSPGTMIVTPKSYIVSERGIVFNHMSQSFILRFPLAKMEVNKEKNLIEVEGKAEASVIPNRLRLLSERIDSLNKILTQYLIFRDS